MKVFIEELLDRRDCEDCGPSFATGFKAVAEDGYLLVELIPFAHCYDERSYEILDLVNAVMQKLAIGVEFEAAPSES